MKTNISFFIVSRSVLLRTKNVSDKSCRENHNTFMLSFSLENPAVYEIVWENTVESNRPQITVWRMRIVCWIPKSTNTYSEYVFLITFPLQRWLHERASLLYVCFLSCFNVCLLAT
jgi:hypothetical protein